MDKDTIRARVLASLGLDRDTMLERGPEVKEVPPADARERLEIALKQLSADPQQRVTILSPWVSQFLANALASFLSSEAGTAKTLDEAFGVKRRAGKPKQTLEQANPEMIDIAADVYRLLASGTNTAAIEFDLKKKYGKHRPWKDLKDIARRHADNLAAREATRLVRLLEASDTETPGTNSQELSPPRC